MKIEEIMRIIRKHARENSKYENIIKAIELIRDMYPDRFEILVETYEGLNFHDELELIAYLDKNIRKMEVVK